MPRKRRTAKGRTLTTGEIEDLFYGPGTCLFNGDGYLAPYENGLWHMKSPDVQATVIEVMRQDWVLFHRTVMQAWQSRTPHDLWCARRHHDNPAEPWALEEFGPID